MKGQMPENKRKHLKIKINGCYLVSKPTKTQRKKSLGKGINNCLRGRESICKYENQKTRLKNYEDNKSKQSYMIAK